MNRLRTLKNSSRTVLELRTHFRRGYEPSELKNFSSETVKWMNPVLCIHVPDSSLYIICVFYSSRIRTLPTVESPWIPWTSWTFSMESMDIVHGIHGTCGQCPWNPWNVWTMFMESVECVDNVQGIHGQCPQYPGYFPRSPWTMSMESMECVDNVHGIHGMCGQCPRNPWTMSTVPWTLSMEFFQHLLMKEWTNSMDVVQSRPWTISTLRITHNPMISDITSFSCFT